MNVTELAIVSTLCLPSYFSANCVVSGHPACWVAKLRHSLINHYEAKITALEARLSEAENSRLITINVSYLLLILGVLYTEVASS